MKKIISLIIIFFFILFLSSCKSNVSLKGKDSITIELGIEYQDEGINIPSNYHFEVSDNIDINKIGSYYYKYVIYDKDDKKVGELIRDIIVKDTTSPTYVEKDIDHLLIGRKYDESYFFDNIVDKSKCYLRSDKDIIFYQEGRYEVNIIITDESSNKCVFKKEYNVIDDKEELLEELKKEDKVIKYNNGDIEVYFGKTNRDYFHFYNKNYDYIYEINQVIYDGMAVTFLNYKYIITVSSEGLSEKTYINFGTEEIGGLSFVYEGYELSEEFLNNEVKNAETINKIKNANALLMLYVEMFSVN